MIRCPLSKWTPLSSIDHSLLLFHFFVALVISHLVTPPLICITPADGFRGRWWDYKSAAAPSDYHRWGQLSMLLDPENLKRPHWEWCTPPQTCTEDVLQSWSTVCEVDFSFSELWLTEAVMEFLRHHEVLALFWAPSAMKMSTMI